MTAPIVPEVYTPVPQRTQPQSDFDNNADLFLASLPGVATGMNALGSYLDALANQVDADAASALASKDAAAASQSQAAASAASAATQATNAASSAASSAASAAAAFASESQAAIFANQSAASSTASASSASQSAASALSSANSKTLAEAAAVSAGQSRDDAFKLVRDTAGLAYISQKVFLTYAEAVVATIANGEFFSVVLDESRGNKKTFYRKLNNVFEFLGFLKPEGLIHQYPTKTKANSFIPFFDENDQVLIQVDESLQGRKTLYHFENRDGTSVSFNFSANTFSTGNPDPVLIFDGYDDPQLVPAPATSSDSGRLGEFAVSGSFFYFHTGNVWLRVQGVTF